MANLSVQAVWSLGPVTHQLNLRDLDVVSTGADQILYGTNGANGGVISYMIDATSGALSLGDTLVVPPVASVNGPAHLEQISFDGQDFIVDLGRHANGLEAVRVASDGGMDTRLALNGTASEAISTLAFHSADTRDLAYAGYWGSSDLGIYQVGTDGAFSFLGQISSPFETHGADIVDFRITSVGDQDILVFASRYQDQVLSYRINENGGLAVADILRASEGLPIATPSAMEIVEMGSQRFAILAASGTSSLTVMEIGVTGQLIPSDHINADTSTRTLNLSAIDTVSVGERSFVVAGGANDGVSLFELFPDGRLFHLDSQEDLDSTALANITAVTAIERDGGIDIYASSESEAGVTQMRADLGVLEERLIGDASANVLTGSAGDDVLFGAGGNDTLSGGSGHDVIIGGTGENRMTGGAGADLFILSPGATRDQITDFELGIDRLDLSGFGRVYDPASLQWSARSAGAVIYHGDRVLVINTSDDTPLRASDFEAADLFNLSHTDLGYMTGGLDPAADFTPAGNIEGSAGADTLRGSQSDDVIRGNLGNDRLYGGDGNDILNGGLGGDMIDGGAGSDWVSFEGSRGSLRVDLMFEAINTNVAQGDSYVSIENMIGSQGFDNLRGNLGDNIIQGGRNVDYIFGRRGDDTLEGGVGDDVLFGGVGADVLIGGENRDRAQYSEAISAVHADLANPANNSGEAAGDIYDGIEDLAGGRFNDELHGDAGGNRLFGREGADRLFGREGNDYLNGGANADYLDGGVGDDVLRGGHSFDTFVFREGRDIVEDFDGDFDFLLIDPALLGGAAATADNVLSYASVVAGDVVFDFGETDQLVLQNVSSLTGLEEDILFL